MSFEFQPNKFDSTNQYVEFVFRNSKLNDFTLFQYVHHYFDIILRFLIKKLEKIYSVVLFIRWKKFIVII